MKNTLRSLERYLACQVAQVALKPIAEDYVERWKLAHERVQPYPSLNEIIEAAAAVRVPTLAEGPLIDYIYNCADYNLTPDPARIVMAVVHGYAEDNLLIHDEPCRCPVKMTLGGPQRPPGRAWNAMLDSEQDSELESEWDSERDC